MTRYTIRNAVTLRPIQSTETLHGAVDRLEVERAAFLLNPPDARILELIVTADDAPNVVGDVVVHFAASDRIDPLHDRPIY